MTECIKIRVSGMDQVYDYYLNRLICISYADECYAENTIVHPKTKEPIVNKGQRLTPAIISAINKAGIRNINVLRQGKHCNINADYDGQAYSMLVKKLSVPCELKARANAYTSSGLYYDPELLTDSLSQIIYLCVLPYMAAIKIPVAYANGFINNYIAKYGYNAAKSEIYGSRKRHSEKSIYDLIEADPSSEEVDLLELVPSDEGHGADYKVMEKNNIAHLYSQGLIKYLRPCCEKNNSLAKGLAAYIYNVVFFDDESHESAISVLSKMINNNMTMTDLGAFIIECVKSFTGFSLSNEANTILETALNKKPTAKAFDEAHRYKDISWRDIPLNVVFNTESFERKLPVICADHVKAIKYFEKSKVGETVMIA